MSVASTNLKRQWIPIVGGSSDVRMGVHALESASALLKAAVGAPKRCMVVFRETLDAETHELLRRQLVDAGFGVAWHALGEGDVATIDEAQRLTEVLCQGGITGDDLCCAIGDVQVLSLASFVCKSWCGSTSLVAIPTDEVALLEGALAPRGLCVAGKQNMLSSLACARHVLLDYDLVLTEEGSETATYARTLMVAAAMCGSERVFSELWDRAEEIASGDEEVLVTQLMATAKSRGQSLSSSAVAIRQSVEYGQAFAHALASVADRPLEHGLLVAEGMRFAARLAVGLEKLSIDDMLAQDELLDTLGVGGVRCNVGPDDLVRALKDELFLRSNRFMLLVPLAIGRVRLATIPDDLLLEHASAWCAAHSD